MDPESKPVVSVKRNPGEHTSAQCGKRGYKNIKPRKTSSMPHLVPAQSHTLHAKMRNSELRVFVDNHEVWEGDVADAAKLDGPVGIRSDNARLEFDVLAREPERAHPRYAQACRTGPAD